MHLARFPRRRYTPFVTELRPLPRLTRHLGGAELWIKRDDQLGLAGGGNKTRKLEFLVAHALELGCDTLVTTGAVQSNHCRLTLAAARREGLQCHLILVEQVPGSYDAHAGGNHFLYQLLGADGITLVQDGRPGPVVMAEVEEALREEGARPYVIPGGGSSPRGALGYASCAFELLQQTFDHGLQIDGVVCASGTGGTHAGLLTGLIGSGSGIPVTGISVERATSEQAPRVLELAESTADLLDVAPPFDSDVEVLDGYIGDGYSLPTEEMREAVQLFARQEGVLLDPVYTGKAAAGLIDQIRRGRWGRDRRVVLLHTGGGPSLFHYRRDVL